MQLAALALTAVTSFGSNPGALDMYEYAPPDLPAGRPIVVVLHGCTQTASAMEAAGWDALADQLGFALVYPQQRSANQQLSCFTWYAPADTARGAGEALSIVQMVDKEITLHGGDPQRVYITGLSAGAAMTAALLASYPDRFRAGSIMSGIPAGCATDVSSGSTCASSGTEKTPAQWGDIVRAADPGFAGPWPRVQIWHGSMDYTVATKNATELVKQWTNVWGADQTADATDMISNATRTQFVAGSTVAVELYLVSGMGHAIATGSDPMGMCPATSGAFFADEKICSTLRAAQFFDLLPDAGGGGSGDPGNGTPGGGSGSDPGSGSGSAAHEDLVGCAVAQPGGVIMVLVAAAMRRARRRRGRAARAAAGDGAACGDGGAARVG